MSDLIWMPPGKQTFQDTNGEPLEEGYVYHYIPGTLTEKDTWQDQAGLTLNENPIRLDAEGRCTIWGDGLYRQIVTDQDGNELWDQVTGMPSIISPADPADSLVVANIAALRALDDDDRDGAPMIYVRGYYAQGDGGDGWFALAPAWGAGDNGGTVIIDADGNHWLRWPQHSYVNARWFGAKGDGVTDDFDAITAALATLMAVYLPKGNYIITESLDMGSSGGDAVLPNRMYGDGKLLSRIFQTTANIPVIKLGGPMGYLRDIEASFAVIQTGNTAAVAIELYALRWSDIKEIRITNAYKAFEIKQAVVYGGANWISSVDIDGIYIENFVQSAMDLVGYLGGCGGVRIGQVYAVSRDGVLPRDVGTVYIFGAFSELSIDVLNCENCAPEEVVYIQTCDSVKIGALHCESIAPRQNFAGLVHVTGSNVKVEQMNVYASVFAIGVLATSYHLFRMDSASKLDVSQIVERGNNVTVPNPRQFSVSGGLNQIRSWGIEVEDFTDIGFFATPAEYVLQDGKPYPLVFLPSQDRGDASVTIEALVDYTTQLFATPLTAIRTITLGTTSAYAGAKFRIVRRPAATGAFALNVGALKALGIGEWCDIEYSATYGWVLTAFGAL